MTDRFGSFSWLAVLVAGSMLAWGDAQAQTSPAGIGLLMGTEKLKVRPGCGPRDRDVLIAEVGLESSGDWFAFTDEQQSYTGSSIGLNDRGSKRLLFFDGDSLSVFVKSLADWAPEICEANVIIASADVRKFLLKINKRSTRAKVILKAKGSVFGDVSGRGTYKARAKGDWIPDL